jgi:hypothetical protein
MADWINADVNGSANIVKKVSNASLLREYRFLIVRPVRVIDLLNGFIGKCNIWFGKTCNASLRFACQTLVLCYQQSLFPFAATLNKIREQETYVEEN